MKIIASSIIILVLLTFSACYKTKSCFTSNRESGAIITLLDNCKYSSSKYADIKTLNSNLYNAFIFTTKKSYDAALSASNEMCYYGNIDFSEYSLLGSEITYGKNSFFQRDVYIDTILKRVTYTIIKSRERSRFMPKDRVYQEFNFMLIKKISNNYTLEIVEKEEICH